MIDTPIPYPSQHDHTFSRLFSLFLAILMSGVLYGQASVQQQAGYYTFGLNAGLSFQSSDVRSLYEGFGLGATLAKNYYYKPGAPISFDLRGRLLYAQQLGLDGQRSFDIADNSVLNGTQALDYTNYPAGLSEPAGFVFQNHKTDVLELGLEGVITLNKLREKTRVIASIYGGLGIDWYRAKIDQAGANGQAYYQEYAGIDQKLSPSAIQSQLKSAILDGNFESLADGFDSEGGNIGIMPSLGIELGYELTPTFSVHVGHRLTFSGNDIMDGQQWANPNNDIYHYTNFALRWKIRPKESTLMAPVIEIITPTSFPFNSPVVNGLVRARIKHIQSAADVTCTINGRNQSFTFNNTQFNKPFALQNGENEVIITATNSVGTAQKRLVIFYEEKTPPPPPTVRNPDVLLTQPRTASSSVKTPEYNVTASITEINKKEQIQFLLNGQRRNFNFNPANGQFQANIRLEKGENTIQIEATNAAGKDSETATITLESGTQPTVRITRPAYSPYNTENPGFQLEATINGVTQTANVTVSLNGNPLSNPTFNPSTGLLSTNLNLREGNNTVRISAQNEWGQGQDEAIIVYQAPRQTRRPEVNITSPSNGFRTQSANTTIQANVRYVDRAGDIEMQVNGRNFNGFSFSNGALSANVPLQFGTNRITISARNIDGQAEDQVSVERFEEVVLRKPPQVNIQSPSNNSVSDQATIRVQAYITEVDRVADIQMLVNGRTFNDFNFDRSRQQLTANVPLIDGNNNIQISARNVSGMNSDQVNVSYRRASPPEVRITQPTANSTVNNEQVNFQASVQHINQKGQIELTLNGQRVSNFNFNTFQREVTASLNLRAGNNTIQIRVANADGQDTDQVNVSFVQAEPPTVRIERPANNSSSTSAQIELSAITTKVSSKGEVQIWLNGQPITNFDLNLFRGQITAAINLREGNNNIRVRVQNGDGSNEDNVNVQYIRPNPPTVNFTNPANNSTSETERISIKASTQKITDRSQIQLTLNGTTISNFGFLSARQEISAQVILIPGNNTLVVKVENGDGKAQDEIRVTYLPQKPPQVSISQPQNGAALTANSTTLTASIQNVKQREEITVLLNGASLSDFKWDGSTAIANIGNLKQGDNTITVKVTNSNGSDEASVTVNYTPIVRSRAPGVKFVLPAEEEITFGENVYLAQASVSNVTSAEQIVITVNNSPIKDFNFTPRTGELSFQVPLSVPRNVVTIVATTIGGTATASSIINYVAKQPEGELPFVRIESVSQPTINPLNPGIARSTISATVKNVTAAQISLMVNTRVITDFTYNPTTGVFQCTFPLDRGENRIVLTATSPAGKDQGVRIVTF
ncbi:MAG: hypothetical protein R2828_18795 [Saprospiraceae bacterium]